jgi:dinuclear metal center YbgI/SA1388 family protein
VPCSLGELVGELERLLEPERFQDYGPNGLQVPGRESVETLVSGVSAGLELFGRASEEGAEAILVHHGLFWGSGPGPIDGPLKARLKVLFDGDISLLAYHLPLDAHPRVGNNALLARALGGSELEPFAEHRGEAIGWIARYPGEGLPASELFLRTEEVLEREPLVFDAGPDLVRRLAIVSGGGSDYLAEAVGAGADAFLTGEPAERVMAEAREARIHFIAAGHHATERLGVRRLGEYLAETFGLRHIFIDIPNPI